MIIKIKIEETLTPTGDDAVFNEVLKLLQSLADKKILVKGFEMVNEKEIR
jgi:hypothetical protein